jgi:hypothetical protein
MEPTGVASAVETTDIDVERYRTTFLVGDGCGVI